MKRLRNDTQFYFINLVMFEDFQKDYIVEQVECVDSTLGSIVVEARKRHE